MKNFMLLLFSFLFSFLFFGCAFNNSTDEINQRENKTIEEKNRVLRNNYDLVTGFYQGHLKLANDERTVTLGIYTLEVKEGSNSSGEPVFKPVLKAVYRQIYPVEMPIVLDGRFVPETGELSFVNSSTSQSIDSLHTINASLSNKKINGVAKTPTGSLGDLNLEFMQKKVDAPLEGDEDQIAEKMRQQYETITGTYIGKIKSSESNEETSQTEWDIEIGIYSLEVKAGTKANGESFFKPVLKAVFKQRTPVVPNLILEAQYIAETGQVFFINPNSNNGDLHSINAKLTNKSIQGTAKRATGLWGNLQLDFSSKNVNTDPAGDENEFNRKLRDQYQQLTGTYRGTIIRETSGNEPRREWKVEIGFYITDVKSGTFPSGEPKFRPSLKARFKQLSPVAPNVLLDVQYITESNQLLLSGSDSIPPSGNSDGLNSISGTLKNNILSGKASKASGYWGELNLQFISKNVDSPSAGDQEDYNRRLTEEYQSLVGSYTGAVNPTGRDFPAFNVEFRIFIVQEAGVNGLTPTLKAYYRRTTDRYNATDLTMNVDYKTELTPPRVDISGQRSNGSLTYFVILNGFFQNNEIRGQYHDQRSHEGPFRFTKVNYR